MRDIAGSWHNWSGQRNNILESSLLMPASLQKAMYGLEKALRVTRWPGCEACTTPSLSKRAWVSDEGLSKAKAWMSEEGLSKAKPAQGKGVDTSEVCAADVGMGCAAFSYHESAWHHQLELQA